MTQTYRADNFNEAQISQWGVQSAVNTRIAATKRLASMGMTLDWRTPTNEVVVPGIRFPRAMQAGIWDSTLKGSGAPSFSDFPFIQCGVHQNVSPSTPGGGTNTRLWQSTQPSSGISDVARYTVQTGNEYYARESADVALMGYTFNFDWQKIDLSFDGEGATIYDMIAMTGFDQKITVSGSSGGTFTLTFLPYNSQTPQTTATIAYNASAATVVAALEALAGIGASGVTATGTLSGGMTVTFAATTAQGMLYATGTSLTGTAPLVKVIGVANATTIATNQLLQLRPQDTCVYLDWAYGSLGTTKLERVFSGSINVSNVRKNFYTVDCGLNGRPAGSADQRPGSTFTLKLMEEWKMEEIRRRLKAGDTAYIRVKNTGSLIEGSLYNYVQWDLPCQLDGSPDGFGDDQGLYAQGLKLRTIDDSNLGYAIKMSSQSTLTAL